MCRLIFIFTTIELGVFDIVENCENKTQTPLSRKPYGSDRLWKESTDTIRTITVDDNHPWSFTARFHPMKAWIPLSPYDCYRAKITPKHKASGSKITVLSTWTWGKVRNVSRTWQQKEDKRKGLRNRFPNCHVKAARRISLQKHKIIFSCIPSLA